MTNSDATITVTCEKQKASKTITSEISEPISWGNTLQDAIQLSAWWKRIRSGDISNLNDARLLIEAYELDSIDFANISFLQTYTNQLRPAQNAATPTGLAPSTTLTATPSTPAASLSGIFSPTLVVDALAKFAAKRFK